MRLLVFISGMVVLSVTLVDVVATAVAVGQGGGALTRRLSALIWRVARALRGRNHQALRRAGLTVLLLTILGWLLLTWAGWTLVFNGGAEAVVDSSSGRPASVEQRMYFAGYSLFTLGNGDYRPGGTGWRIATVVAVANGFALVSLAITYLLPVLSAATEKRQLASRLHALGPSPQDLLVAGWDGAGFGRLLRDVDGLGPDILLLEQRHFTYPVLHYLHGTQPRTSAPLRLVALDEAITLLQYAVRPEARPDPQELRVLRAGLDAYLEAVGSAYVRPADEAPPLPDLKPLKQAGIPTVAEEEFTHATRALADRRRRLLGLLEHDGWVWDALPR